MSLLFEDAHSTFVALANCILELFLDFSDGKSVVFLRTLRLLIIFSLRRTFSGLIGAYKLSLLCLSHEFDLTIFFTKKH